MHKKERKRILSEAMNELNPGMRKAIELRELGERLTEATARMMGISVAAVKARVVHGRTILREKLKLSVRIGLDLRKGHFTNARGHRRCLAKSGRLQCVRLRRARREALLMTFLFVAVLAILGFLRFTGPDG